ncbi:phosphoribosylamine--glycine ligase [Candidatus Woesearchaeota archaeon]|nr:phosphoribosylamine--glycine ligase [Candidatus Woesearchaeota archaeon]
MKLGSYADTGEIANFAISLGIDFAVIGPEEPLSHGVADALDQANIPCVGPKKELARLETSKSFTRLLMKKYKIPGLPQFKVFESMDGVEDFLNELPGIVIKPDGLTGGKGVLVQGDHFQAKEEALAHCRQILESHPSVVVEEKLDGEEFSLQSFTDGNALIHCPPVQDHKRAFAGDKGPNTGGMGSYSCADHLLPFLKEEELKEAKAITKKVLDALAKETGELYKGVMYGGFIATKYGVKLIEYNARMGDPEAMNALSILSTDFGELCSAIALGKLGKIKGNFEHKSTVCKYAVPEGYPAAPQSGKKIFLGDVPKNCRVYYASVDKRKDDLFTSSSRAAAFVGIAPTLEEAEAIAENGVSSAQGLLFHREDIGTEGLIQKRVQHMKKLRGE